MPSTPYDRIRRRVERRGPPRRQQPQPPISSLHMITQLFTHMFQWIDQLQTNQEALVAQVQQLQGQQVETAHDVNAIWQCMTGPEEHLEEDDLFPGPSSRSSSSDSSSASAATESTWRCPNTQLAIASNVEIAGPSTAYSTSSSSVYTMVCSCGCGQNITEPSTSNAAASVTAATAQMTVYDMDSRENVMVTQRAPTAVQRSVLLEPLPPPFFPSIPSLLLPPPPPPQMPPLPPPPPPKFFPSPSMAEEEDFVVFQDPEQILNENGELVLRWRAVWLSDLPIENEHPDVVAPRLRNGRCQICLEGAPEADVLWRPNSCGHLQLCDGCMNAGPGCNRIDIRIGNGLTSNEAVRRQLAYLHHQRLARRQTGDACVSNGCEESQCGHWQMLVDFQQRGLECEICKRVFSGYIREAAAPPPSPPPPAPTND